MNASVTLGELAAALSKAQGEMKSAALDTVNPFFKSKYASLASVMAACRAALAANGLSIIQPTRMDENGIIILCTTMLHESGEWVGSEYPIVPDKNTPQALGSAMTYARRYTLSAMIGVVADEDDDGNSASGNGNQQQQSAQRQPERPVQRPAVQKPAPVARARHDIGDGENLTASTLGEAPASIKAGMPGDNPFIAPPPVARTQRNDAQELMRDVDEVEEKHHGYNADAEDNPFHDVKTSLRDIVFEGNTGKFIDACRREEANSDGYCTKQQYGFLKSVVIGIGSEESHHDILHVLAGRPANSENLPGFGLAKYLLDVLPAESGKKGEKVKNTDARHPGAVAAVKEIHAKLSA